MWKTYDLTTKSRTQFLKDHIYVTNPVKALGKCKYSYFKKGREFMVFHLGDAYFFMNEIIKTQPTSQEESEAFSQIVKVTKKI